MITTLNSRDINLLRSDVAANCRLLISEMNKLGFKVGVMTVRDDEYQLDCYKRGTGSKPPATFHSTHAGLAFDVFQNVKGQEYSNAELFRQAGIIGKKLGFTWGGGWSKFPDKPHFQWDAHGKFTGSDIVKRRYPPMMPTYKEEENLTTQETTNLIYKLVPDLLAKALHGEGTTPSPWAVDKITKAVADGLTDGTRPLGYAKREEVIAMIVNAKEK